MQMIKNFNNENVRIFLVDEMPYFAAVDVCNILNIKNSRQAISYLDSDDVISGDAVDRLGKKVFINYVNEGGLYQLVFRSRKESAKKFKKWVTHDVLPSIRKTGKYSVPENLIKESTKNRNLLTDEWKRHGIENPSEYIKLTLKEYRELNIVDKRKKDFNKKEMLLINALEAMESLKLYSCDEVSGVNECLNSIEGTAKSVKILSHEELK